MESNIIIATFKDGVTFTQTAKQWQWDRGMILKIEGVDVQRRAARPRRLNSTVFSGLSTDSPIFLCFFSETYWQNTQMCV